MAKTVKKVDPKAVAKSTLMDSLKGFLDKFKKDKLWKVTVIIPKHDVIDFRNELLDLDLIFNEYQVNTKMGDTKGFDVFTKNQKESATLREALAKYPQVRYHIAEIGKQL